MKYSFTLKILSILLLIGLAFSCSTEEDSMPENNFNNQNENNLNNSAIHVYDAATINVYARRKQKLWNF